MPGSYYLRGEKIVDKLSGIQIPIQITDHWIIRLLLTFWKPDLSGIQILILLDKSGVRSSCLTSILVFYSCKIDIRKLILQLSILAQITTIHLLQFV